MVISNIRLPMINEKTMLLDFSQAAVALSLTFHEYLLEKKRDAKQVYLTEEVDFVDEDESITKKKNVVKSLL